MGRIQKRHSQGLFYQGTAIVVLITFFCQNIISATPVSLNSKIYNPRSKVNIHIPEQYGTIEKLENPNLPEQPLVVLVKDAHCNYEAQKNIANILDVLIRDYKVDLVCVEGASGTLNIRPYQAFPEEKIKEKVVDSYIKKGLLSAGEALAICKGDKIPFGIWGVEDKKLYLENLHSFRKTYKENQDVLNLVSQLITITNNLKQKIYHKELLEYDRRMQGYNENTISLVQLCSYLSNRFGIHRVPNIKLVLKSHKLEKRINFKIVETERATLIKQLEKDLPKEDLQEFVKNSLLYRLQKISSSSYYNYLKKFIQNPNGYPNLSIYIKLISLQNRIDSDSLFNEIDSIKEKIYNNFFRDNIQRKFHRIDYNLSVLIKLLRLQLSRKDLDYYKSHSEEFELEKIIEFLRIQSMVHNISFPNLLDNINPEFSISAEKFYEQAMRRDKTLTKNLIKKMHNENKNMAVIVAGGFHTEGILEILEKENTDYIVISPKITKNEIDNPYLSLMLDERLDIERYLKDSIANNIPLPLVLDNDIQTRLSQEAQSLLANLLIKEKGLGLKEFIRKYKGKLDIQALEELFRIGGVSIEGKEEETIKSLLKELLDPDALVEKIIENPTNPTYTSFLLELLIGQLDKTLEDTQRDKIIYALAKVSASEGLGAIADRAREIALEEIDYAKYLVPYFNKLDEGTKSEVLVDIAKIKSSNIPKHMKQSFLQGLKYIIENNKCITKDNIDSVTKEIADIAQAHTPFINEFCFQGIADRANILYSRRIRKDKDTGAYIIKEGSVLAAKVGVSFIVPNVWSCICLYLYDPKTGVYSISHITIPGVSFGFHNPLLYSRDNIRAMVDYMQKLGAGDPSSWQAIVIGGVEDKTGQGIKNVKAVEEELRKLGIPIVVRDTGSEYGRDISRLKDNAIEVNYLHKVRVGNSDYVTVEKVSELAPRIIQIPMAIDNYNIDKLVDDIDQIIKRYGVEIDSNHRQRLRQAIIDAYDGKCKIDVTDLIEMLAKKIEPERIFQLTAEIAEPINRFLGKEAVDKGSKVVSAILQEILELIPEEQRAVGLTEEDSLLKTIQSIAGGKGIDPNAIQSIFDLFKGGIDILTLDPDLDIGQIDASYFDLVRQIEKLTGISEGAIINAFKKRFEIDVKISQGRRIEGSPLWQEARRLEEYNKEYTEEKMALSEIDNKLWDILFTSSGAKRAVLKTEGSKTKNQFLSALDVVKKDIDKLLNLLRVGHTRSTIESDEPSAVILPIDMLIELKEDGTFIYKPGIENILGNLYLQNITIGIMVPEEDSRYDNILSVMDKRIKVIRTNDIRTAQKELIEIGIPSNRIAFLLKDRIKMDKGIKAILVEEETPIHIAILFGLIYARIDVFGENGELTEKAKEVIGDFLKRVGDMDEGEIRQAIEELNRHGYFTLKIIRILETLNEFQNCRLFIEVAA